MAREQIQQSIYPAGKTAWEMRTNSTIAAAQTISRAIARYCPTEKFVLTAVMHTHQLTHIITTDQHFDQIDGIIRLDPQELFIRG